MAKLSSNGREIGRVELLGRTLAFMESGKILGNSGGGWYVRCRVKPGDVRDAFEKASKRVRDLESRVPEYRAFRDALFTAIRGRKQRTQMYNALRHKDTYSIWNDQKLMDTYKRLAPLYEKMAAAIAVSES